MRDEFLYRANLLSIDELHPDCEPGDVKKFVQVARDYLALSGQRPPPITEPVQIMARALSTSDFPDLLEDIANKSLTTGLQQRIRNLADMGQANDGARLQALHPTAGAHPGDATGDRGKL